MMTRNEIERAVPVQNLMELVAELINDVGLDVEAALAAVSQAVVDEMVIHHGAERNTALQLEVSLYVIRSYQEAVLSAASHGVNV